MKFKVGDIIQQKSYHDRKRKINNINDKGYHVNAIDKYYDEDWILPINYCESEYELDKNSIFYSEMQEIINE